MRTSTNTDDRCIFAVYSDGSQNITEFHHDGGNLVIYADSIVATLADSTPSNTFSDVTFIAPAFSTKIEALLWGSYADADVGLYWRTNGQTGAVGHLAASVVAGATRASVVTSVITDSSHIIEIRYSAATTNTIDAWASGWYFGIGI